LGGRVVVVFGVVWGDRIYRYLSWLKVMETNTICVPG